MKPESFTFISIGLRGAYQVPMTYSAIDFISGQETPAMKKIILKIWRQQYGFDRSSVVISGQAIARSIGISERGFWYNIGKMKSDTDEHGFAKQPSVEDIKKNGRVNGVVSIRETSELRINFHDTAISNDAIGIHPSIFGIPHWFFDGVGAMGSPLREWKAVDIDMFIRVCAMYYQHFTGSVRVMDLGEKPLAMENYSIKPGGLSKTAPANIRKAVRKLDSMGLIVLSGGRGTGIPMSFRLPLAQEKDDCAIKWQSIVGDSTRHHIAEAELQNTEVKHHIAEAGHKIAQVTKSTILQKEASEFQKPGIELHKNNDHLAQGSLQSADNEVVVVKSIDTTNIGQTFRVSENFNLIIHGESVETSLETIIDWLIEQSTIRKTKASLKFALRKKAMYGGVVVWPATDTEALNIGPYVDYIKSQRVSIEEEKILGEISKIIYSNRIVEVRGSDGVNKYYIKSVYDNNFVIIDSIEEKADGVTVSSSRIVSSIRNNLDTIYPRDPVSSPEDPLMAQICEHMARGSRVAMEAPGDPEKDIVVKEVLIEKNTVVVESKGVEQELHIGQVRIYLSMLGYSLNIEGVKKQRLAG